MDYKGYTITIERDEDAESPREWDNLGTMIYWSRRYAIGDVDGNTIHDSPGAFEEWAESEGVVVLPVYLYDHSVQRVSTKSWAGRAHHADWDSGQVGFIYMSPEKFFKESSPEGALHAVDPKAITFKADGNMLRDAKAKATLERLHRAFKAKRLTKTIRAAIESYMASEVEVYDQYMSGDIHGYIVNGPEIDGDSCWGFYGEDSAIEEAKSIIDHTVGKESIEQWENKAMAL